MGCGLRQKTQQTILTQVAPEPVLDEAAHVCLALIDSCRELHCVSSEQLGAVQGVHGQAHREQNGKQQLGKTRVGRDEACRRTRGWVS